MRYWTQALLLATAVLAPMAHADNECLSPEHAFGNFGYWVNFCQTQANVAWRDEGDCAPPAETHWITMCAVSVPSLEGVLVHLDGDFLYYACMGTEYPVERDGEVFCSDWEDMSEQERQSHHIDLAIASNAVDTAIERAQLESDEPIWKRLVLREKRTPDEACDEAC